MCGGRTNAHRSSERPAATAPTLVARAVELAKDLIRLVPLGQAIVPNGIPLSKIHHAAFDAHLIGIDPDFRVHVANRLLRQNDGPMLEVLKKLHHGQLHLPARRKDWPDQERLALRFDEFRGYE
jgi:hypothetical protein